MNVHRIAQEMRPVVYRAGEIAMRHFRNVKAERKADRSFVTAADREVEDFVRGEIQRLFPDHGYFGEETGLNQIEGAEYVWAVDPIDGTAPFVYEFPIWGVSVGLIGRNGPLLGFVLFPAVGDLFWTDGGGTAYVNEIPIRVGEPKNLGMGGTLIISSKILKNYEITFPGRTLAFGSAAASICYTAKGKVQGGLQEAIRLYDLAGSAAVLKAAGGVMRYASGREVDLWELTDGRKTPEPMYFGHPENVEQLLELFKFLGGDINPAGDEEE